MGKVLFPLKELINVNFAYKMFHLKYLTEDGKVIRNFKINVIVDKYCRCLQEVLHILFYESIDPQEVQNSGSKIVCCPDIRNLFYKL